MEAEIILEKLMSYFNVINYSELAEKIGIQQQNISKWKSRNSISAIKKKCRELGIYNELFNDSQISNKEEIEDKTTNDLPKYFIALQSVASATNKEDELIEDIKTLMKKYIGE